VVEQIGRLAYRLAVPEEWKVHPVFTITQLVHIQRLQMTRFSVLVLVSNTRPRRRLTYSHTKSSGC
jgi:hypothetical protein